MRNDDPIYQIVLDDYRSPRYSSTTRPYYGTIADIRRMMFELSMNNHTRVRYAETIEAVNNYDHDPKAVHHMAGSEFPILTPMTKTHRHNFVMSDVSWHYTGISGAVFPARAESVHVDQILLQHGNMLYRCAKVEFHALAFCFQVCGWVNVHNEMRGFPAQIIYDSGMGYQMSLYTHLESYAETDHARAVQDCGMLSHNDLSTLCVDILGEV